MIMEDEIKDVEKLMIIEQQLGEFLPILSKAADEIMDQDVSKYPIFVLHKQEVALGIPIIDKAKHKTQWSVNASTLEEFAVKNLIKEEKLDDFRKTYKNPGTHLCVFVLSDIGAQFLFIPRNRKAG